MMIYVYGCFAAIVLSLDGKIFQWRLSIVDTCPSMFGKKTPFSNYFFALPEIQNESITFCHST